MVFLSNYMSYSNLFTLNIWVPVSLLSYSYYVSTQHLYCFYINILKVQSCKLYNNKHMIASTEITNTEMFALFGVVVFKLLSRKVLFINRKYNRNCSRYTNADLKISLYVWVHIKTVTWKFRILNPRNSGIICP